MKRVACYVRVSHEEQVNHGISVDAQIEALTQYAKENHYKIVNIYSDAGISARKSYKNRPALLQMINDCQLGKIDLILICKLDRFFRSVPDYYAVMSQIGGVPWKAIHEDYETETSAGVFKVNIMLSVAQSEADRTSERIKKVFEYKKSKGEVCSGGVAFGYKIENKRWVKDKEAEPFVNAIFETYLTTLSNRKAQAKCIEMGHNISMDAIQKMLSSPAYYGEAPYVADTYITKEQHELIMKSKKRAVRTNKYDYVFSGLCYCGLCGCKMTASRAINKHLDGSEKHFVRYSCNNRKRYADNCYGASISEEKLENILIDTLDYEFSLYNMNKQYKLISSSNTDTQKKLNQNKARLNRLKDLYEMGDISIEDYKAKKESILKEISSLELQPIEKPKTLPENWKDTYKQLDRKHKNAFWISIINKIIVPERTANTVELRF